MFVTFGALCLVFAVLLVFLHVPTAAALAGIALAGTFLLHLFSDGTALTQTWAALSAGFWQVITQPIIFLLPIFVLLGNVAFYAGISTRIYDAALASLRHVPGGMALASVLGCGGFAAIAGSSVACAATMGRICVPDMLKQGYDPKLATASVAVGGTLGSLIPPSVVFILYGFLTGASVEALFLAGILPGLLSLIGMLLAVVWWVWGDRAAAPAAPQSEVARSHALMAALPALGVFVILMGGIFSGLVGAAGAGILCTVVAMVTGVLQGRLDARVMVQVLRETVVQTVAILLIALAAKLFMDFVGLTGLSQAAMEWIQTAQPSYVMLMFAIVVIYLLAGMFLEPVAVLALTIPFVAPLVQIYGLDPVWFGIIIVKLLEIGLLTPPIGLNVFVISAVTGMSIGQIFGGVSRFLAIDILVLMILVLFPIVATLIPSAM